jgi:hypothetical protein
MESNWKVDNTEGLKGFCKKGVREKDHLRGHVKK